MVKTCAALLLLLTLSACNFPTHQAFNEATLTVAVLQTQVAQAPVQTVTASASQTQAANQQPVIPSTGGVVLQTAAPQPAQAARPNVPATGAATVTVSIDTNCRSGPARKYPLLGVLYTGQSAVVVGKNTALNYLIIQNPDGQGTCWLWGQYASVSGNVAAVPEVANPDP